MSEEEIIEIIEKLQCEYKEQQNNKKYNDYTVFKAKEYSKGLQGLLDLYNKEKEYAMGLYYDVQGLQQDLDKEKEKNNTKLLYNANTDTFTSIKALDNNFIEKSKIKELINKRGNNGYTSLDCIDDIEKLLEE